MKGIKAFMKGIKLGKNFVKKTKGKRWKRKADKGARPGMTKGERQVRVDS